MVRPSSPSAEAICTAVSRMALRVRSPWAFRPFVADSCFVTSQRYIARTFVLDKNFAGWPGFDG